MLQPDRHRCAAWIWHFMVLGALLLGISALLAAQQTTEEQSDSEEDHDRALVERSFPQRIIQPERGYDSYIANTPLAERYGFVTTDLNKTGKEEFIVADYAAPYGVSGAVRVLRRSNGETVSEFNLACAVGLGHPEISTINLDHSGKPGVLVEFHTDRYIAIDWLFKWTGMDLVPINPTNNDEGFPCTSLRDSEFIDLDGDGTVEIINRSKPFQEDTPDSYDVYKLIDGTYKLSGMLEYFGGFPVPISPPPARFRIGRFIASAPKTPYILTIANGGGVDNAPPVRSAQVFLNGEPVTTPGQITQSVRSLKIPVTVKARNTVNANVTGPQDALLWIGIGPVASPESKSAAAANSKQ